MMSRITIFVAAVSVIGSGHAMHKNGMVEIPKLNPQLAYHEDHGNKEVVIINIEDIIEKADKLQKEQRKHLTVVEDIRVAAKTIIMFTAPKAGITFTINTTVEN